MALFIDMSLAPRTMLDIHERMNEFGFVHFLRLLFSFYLASSEDLVLVLLLALILPTKIDLENVHFDVILLCHKLKRKVKWMKNDGLAFSFWIFKIFFWCGPFLKTLLNFLQCFFCFMLSFFFFFFKAPWPRIEHRTSALEGEILTNGLPGSFNYLVLMTGCLVSLSVLVFSQVAFSE